MNTAHPMVTPHLTWRTSSHSTGTGSCVEYASTTHAVLLRDTKNRVGGTLSFTTNQWKAFLAHGNLSNHVHE